MESRYKVWIIAPAVGIVLAVAGFAGLRAWDRGVVLVDIRDLATTDSVSRGFILPKAADLEIDAVGAGSRPPHRRGSSSLRTGLGRTWIVDRATGNVIWELRDADTQPLRSDLDVYQGTLRFPAGEYLVHYVCEPTNTQRSRSGSWVDWINDESRTGDDESTASDSTGGFHITIRGRGHALTSGSVEVARETATPTESRQVRSDREIEQPSSSNRQSSQPQRRGPDLRGVIVELTRLEDDELASEVFSVTRRSDIRIYAVGEGENGEMYDAGWIVNKSTGRKVWEMEYDDTYHAGGASKNRVVDDTIRLRPGDYEVYFQTDDSHSFENWNASAPDDERSWGITISATRNRRGDFEVERRLEDSRGELIAQLVGIRHDERRRIGFSLDHRTTVLIYAIGEGDSGRERLFDYAWIEDARTRQRVWEMTFSNTSHAGGDEKNRIFNDTVWLPSGDYILRYRSDNSHSPSRWNADPPDDLLYYGVTVFKQER